MHSIQTLDSAFSKATAQDTDANVSSGLCYGSNHHEEWKARQMAIHHEVTHEDTNNSCRSRRSLALHCASSTPEWCRLLSGDRSVTTSSAGDLSTVTDVTITSSTSSDSSRVLCRSLIVCNRHRTKQHKLQTITNTHCVTWTTIL